MKLSVIIPAYNCEKYIQRCIESVKRQQGAELEIIVVNDGSCDSTEEVLKNSPDIKVVTVKNGGAASARNTGLGLAGGDFIMFVDSDDFLKDGSVEKMIEKQKNTGADIVRFGYLEYYENGVTKSPLHAFKEEIEAEKDDFKEKIYPCYINGIQLNSICMTLFRKEIIKDIRFRTDMHTAEDALFSMEAYSNAEKVVISPEICYMYNRGDGSLTGSGLSVKEKYRCNFLLSTQIAKKLPLWKMNSPYWYFKTYMRPIILTVDKLRRNKLSRTVEGK